MNDGSGFDLLAGPSETKKSNVQILEYSRQQKLRGRDSSPGIWKKHTSVTPADAARLLGGKDLGYELDRSSPFLCHRASTFFNQSFYTLVAFRNDVACPDPEHGLMDNETFRALLSSTAGGGTRRIKRSYLIRCGKDLNGLNAEDISEDDPAIVAFLS
jgi:hypothetical protein